MEQQKKEEMVFKGLSGLEGAEWGWEGVGHCVLIYRTAPPSSSYYLQLHPFQNKVLTILNTDWKGEELFFSFYIESVHTFKQPLPT